MGRLKNGYTEAGLTAAQELSNFPKCPKTVPHWEVTSSPLPEVFKHNLQGHRTLDLTVKEGIQESDACYLQALSDLISYLSSVGGEIRLEEISYDLGLYVERIQLCGEEEGRYEANRVSRDLGLGMCIIYWDENE